MTHLAKSPPAASSQANRVADMKQLSSDFYSIYDQYHDRLKRFVVMTIVKDEWIADDIVQEAFSRVYSKMYVLKDKDKIKAWLFRVAYRLCLDHFRNENRNPLKDTIDFESINRSCHAATEKELEQHQMSLCIQNQMLLLSENYRIVIWLFDVLGFTLKETAEILELKVENVKIRLHRARKRLKLILKQNCCFERDQRDVLVCEPRDGLNWQRISVENSDDIICLRGSNVSW